MEKILLPLHFLVLGFTAWNVVCADHMGLNWMRGKVKILDKNQIKKYHYRVWAGLIMMIITGFSLFWPLRELLLTRTQFYVKMGLVLTLLINSFSISYLQGTATTHTFASLSYKEKVPLFISGVVSTVCWIFTAAAGFYLLPD